MPAPEGVNGDYLAGIVLQASCNSEYVKFVETKTLKIPEAAIVRRCAGNRERQRKECRAFTLVELLVVIVIIAVLAAILVPVISRSRVQANQVACLSNMRQIGGALLLYTNENNGEFPPTTHSTGHKIDKAWIFQLERIIPDLDKVRICPADPKGKERLANNGTSYTLNSHVFVPTLGPFGQKGDSFTNIRRIVYPAHTFLAFIISDQQGVTTMSDHTHSDRWRGNWQRVCLDIEPNRHRSGNSNATHTNGSGNYLFADGHVENIEAEKIKAWVESGVDFAKVPLEHEDIAKRQQ